jgi:peptide/nickel transport system substrate-binding protein
LDPDARFSDGTPVTADDVAASIRAYADTRIQSPIAGALQSGGFLGADVVDTHTVRVRFAQPWAPARTYLGLEVGIWPGSLVRKLAEAKDPEGVRIDPVRDLVGCGPYRITDYRVKQWAALEPVGSGPPYLVRFQAPQAAESDMRKQEIDATYAEPGRQGVFAGMSGVRVVSYPYWEMVTVALNAATGTPTGDSAELREAILLAVDSERIRTEVAAPAADGRPAGAGTGPAGGKLFVGAQDVYNAPDLVSHAASFDTDRANALLDRAKFLQGPDGYRRLPDGRPLQLALVGYKSIPEYKRVCGRIAEDLERLLHIRTLEPQLSESDADMKKILAHTRDWSLFVAEWPYHEATDPSLASSLSSRSIPRGAGGSGKNFARVSGEKLDRLIEQSDRTLDPRERATAFHQLTRHLAGLHVVKGLYSVQDAWALGPRVEFDTADPNVKWSLEHFPETFGLKR